MLREDGRRQNQVRNIDFQIGIDKTVNGSCHYRQGLTEVIALIHGPKEKTQDELIVIEYSVSPFSSIDSKRNSKFDKEFSQFAENLRKSFQNLIIIDPNVKTEILISVCVIQNDGSSKSAIFNAINLALLDSGIPMKDFIVSCTVGLLNGSVIADLTQEESKNAMAELTISFQSRKKKTDYFEMKSQKVSINEVDSLITQSAVIAEEIYQLLRSNIIKQSIKRLLM